MASRDAAVYLLHEDRTIVGYFTLSAGSVSKEMSSPRVGRRAPDPVPMILLGRMGVHVDRQGEGLGAELVRQALLRSVRSAEGIGARGLMLHAIDETARNFYLHLGFEESPVNAHLMMLTFADLQVTINHAAGRRLPSL